MVSLSRSIMRGAVSAGSVISCSDRDLGTCGGMIDADPAFKPCLELSRVLANVVQQSRYSADVAATHGLKERSRARARVFKMCR